jgi:hypothetical protein
MTKINNKIASIVPNTKKYTLLEMLDSMREQIIKMELENVEISDLAVIMAGSNVEETFFLRQQLTDGYHIYTWMGLLDAIKYEMLSL